MVDQKQISTLLSQDFQLFGEPEIAPDGTVSVVGSVYAKVINSNSHTLSVKFSTVTGDFIMSNLKLTSLAGSPDWVGGNFRCDRSNVGSLVGAPTYVAGDFDVRFCNLSSLEGGPQIVRGDYMARRNPLTSLVGLADEISGELDFKYDANLGLLRSLVAFRVVPMGDDGTKQVPLYDILNKYTGQGKPGALKCAAELIRAGYKENARW